MICAVPRCRRPMVVVYYDRPVCDWHWAQLCDDDTARCVRKQLGVLGRWQKDQESVEAKELVLEENHDRSQGAS